MKKVAKKSETADKAAEDKVMESSDPEPRTNINQESEKKVHRHEHDSNIVPAFFFIFLGLLFLANNLGILPWRVWSTIWRFWPVFLILLGIQMLLGKSLISRIIIFLLTLLLMLAVFWYILGVNGVIRQSDFLQYRPVMEYRRGWTNSY